MPSRSLSRTTWFAIIGATLLSGLILWETARYARSVALDEIRTRSAYTLDLVVENLRGELAKYSFQPRLLAHSTILTDALTQYPQASAIDRANSELERINEVTGARATYLMNKDGLTIAASNWSSDKPFVGSNFSFRPYFKEAMQGRLGRFSALGTTSGERGYYFAHPVRNADGIIGVVVVKMGVARLETAWRAGDDVILILDEEGIVFLSSRPEWRLNAISPLTAAAHQRLSETRRYAGEAHRELSFSRAPDSDIIEIGNIDASGTSNSTKKYVAISAPMNEAGWRVLILADASGVAYRVQIALLVVGFMLASAVLASLNIYQRRRRLNERLELQEAAKAELGDKVRARTKDLSRAVARLRAEVSERQRAEEDLRRTQEELIQASKLSALGRLSAGLSHELNQPLTAIRNYAENARVFLSRNNTATTDANLGSIVEMGERMARIIRNLRTYARNEPVGSRPARLLQSIRDSIGLLQPELRSAGIEVTSDFTDDELMVIGGDVRLQQVFVNLISNAIDAMSNAPRRHLTVSVEPRATDVAIAISDTGPGLRAKDMNRVFDPFFTTKEVGKGTGLGLSITYGIVNQFGGYIEAANNDDGGATFTVTLQRVESNREAAE